MLRANFSPVGRTDADNSQAHDLRWRSVRARLPSHLPIEELAEGLGGNSLTRPPSASRHDPTWVAATGDRSMAACDQRSSGNSQVILIDTSAWVEFFRNRGAAAAVADTALKGRVERSPS